MDETAQRWGDAHSSPPLAPSQVTSWTLIDHAAGGSAAAREEFCRRYLPVVRAYLSSRWRGLAAERHLEDAGQEVFLRCLRHGGLLERADPVRGRGFQGYLYGLTRNVAREFEARDARSAVRAEPSPPEEREIPADEEALTRHFDRAFARAVVREATELMQARAEAGGEAARSRVQLLRLRFEEGVPIRSIAGRWRADPERLHGEYRRARREFERALLDAAAEHVPGRTPGDVRAYCEELLDLLA